MPQFSLPFQVTVGVTPMSAMSFNLSPKRTGAKNLFSTVFLLEFCFVSTYSSVFIHLLGHAELLGSPFQQEIACL